MFYRLLNCLLLGLVLTGCVTEPKVYFKNPIFYEPMYGNRTYYDKIITPVAMVHFHNDEVLPAKCKVLNDVGYQITMECLAPPYRVTPERMQYYRLTSVGRDEFHGPTCLIFQEMFYDSIFQDLTMSSYFFIRKKEGEDCGQTAPQSLIDSYKL